jgi:hypothetical protein
VRVQGQALTDGGGEVRMRLRLFACACVCVCSHCRPEEALISVARNFLEDNEIIPEQFKDSMAQFMAYVHGSVNDMSQVYLADDRRYNYTTPKSYLEQIALYLTLLEQQSTKIQSAMDRMENGLTKLNATAAQVDDMKAGDVTIATTPGDVTIATTPSTPPRPQRPPHLQPHPSWRQSCCHAPALLLACGTTVGWPTCRRSVGPRAAGRG